jgi:TM2 domain-containing membrane protein YozV
LEQNAAETPETRKIYNTENFVFYSDIMAKKIVKKAVKKRDAVEMREKNWLLALLLSIFFGCLGVDRFYMGYVGTGVLKLIITLITLGFGGIVWWVIDLVLIASKSSVFKEIKWTEK